MNTTDLFQQALITTLENSGSNSVSGLEIGTFTVESCYALHLMLSNQVAKESNQIPSQLQFQKWFQTSYLPPVEPDPNDSEFNPPGIWYNTPQEREIARALRYEKAKKKYEKKNLQYRQKQERIRAILSTYRADGGGYLQYILDSMSNHYPDFAKDFFFKPRTFHISETARRRHTFITGGTGSGKSETLKCLVRHYLTDNTDTSIAVLDPHGKLALEIARFNQFSENDRLVLIDANLSDEYSVTINPLEVSDKSEAGLETQCAHLTAAFEQILGGFTQNMHSLLPPVISVLLHREYSDLTDLVRFLDDNQNKDLLDYAKTQMPYEEHRRFFEHQFHSPNYESTKDALRNRFQSFINIPTIKRFTCGRSTVNLEKAIDEKKVIIFNLSVTSASQSTTKILGQFITALLQGYSMRRERFKNNPKTPIHLFADECQYFMSSTTESILGESRKYGLHLTLATQRTEQVGEKILDAILGNVGVFLVGRNLGKTMKKMSSELEIAKDDIRSLKTGDFFLSALNRLPIKIQVPFTGDKHKMDAKKWNQLRQQQLGKYYRSISKPETTTETNNSNSASSGFAFPLPNANVNTDKA